MPLLEVDFQHSVALDGSPNEGENIGLILIRVLPPEEMRNNIKVFKTSIKEFKPSNYYLPPPTLNDAYANVRVVSGRFPMDNANKGGYRRPEKSRK